MKSTTIFLTLFVIAVAYDDVPHDAKYYDSLLSNEEDMKNLFGCVLGNIPCDEFGEHAKGHMIETLTDGCNECDTTQKHYARLIKELVENGKYIAELAEFKSKFDSDGKLLKMFEDKVKGY